MEEFIQYLGNRVFVKPDLLFYEPEIIHEALELTLKDVNYHFDHVSMEDLVKRIINNQNELAIFLYRFGSTIHSIDSSSKSLNAIHFLMKDLCSCEIYYSNQIGEGFYIVHGTGTVIGSRNKIGKGFKIYQNCTIGHRNETAKGNIINDDVICYAGVKIIGENVIGKNAIIGANTVVTKNIPNHKVVYGNPLNIKDLEKETNLV
ncbi:serine acetyltransferase [Algoriphagus machipongonensis]|uniref:Serine O-acetyltransferase n=1 Tax=Algoriphagus machipongonensis TaxID=388413 RepID=A3HV28_9BACT|nr:serine acetyltransferase [Algoriphagus machipongonensis]EAZ82000.1 serine O-acetyltransferase [Algoriphagus machipongonensis]